MSNKDNKVQKNAPHEPQKQKPGQQSGPSNPRGGQQGGPGQKRENQESEKERKYPGQGQDIAQDLNKKGVKKNPGVHR